MHNRVGIMIQYSHVASQISVTEICLLFISCSPDWFILPVLWLQRLLAGVWVLLFQLKNPFWKMCTMQAASFFSKRSIQSQHTKGPSCVCGEVWVRGLLQTKWLGLVPAFPSPPSTAATVRTFPFRMWEWDFWRQYLHALEEKKYAKIQRFELLQSQVLRKA